MVSLSFRYTENINAVVRNNGSGIKIIFKNSDEELMIIDYDSNSCFKYLLFKYNIFSNDSLTKNYVKLLSKYGHSFLARVYVDGRGYAIRKKKNHPDLVFMKACDRGFKSYQFGVDVVDAVAYRDGHYYRDDNLIANFFKKRETKPFNEEEYLKTLSVEERKDYLDDKKIEDIVGKICELNNLSKEIADQLAIYIECLPDDSEVKNSLLKDLEIEHATAIVLPLIDAAKKFSSESDWTAIGSTCSEEKTYSIDDKLIYCNGDFDSFYCKPNDDYEPAFDLLYFFEDEYEQIKECLENSIKKVKDTIDQVLPAFKNYIQESND